MSTDTTLQFVRLIAEAAAAGSFTDEVIESISTAMDLEHDEVTVLTDRAIWLSKHELSQTHPAESRSTNSPPRTSPDRATGTR